MNIVVALAFVGGLFLLGLLGGVAGMAWIFGVVLPYLAGSRKSAGARTASTGGR